ncbi:MAG: hypothetical protein OT478_24630 [Cyanobacteria bacterium FC1]|nr:hypothetical protein [Cyanobacteria bacterium FC1]
MLVCPILAQRFAGIDREIGSQLLDEPQDVGLEARSTQRRILTLRNCSTYITVQHRRLLGRYPCQLKFSLVVLGRLTVILVNTCSPHVC